MILYLLIGEKHVLSMFQIGHSFFYKSENHDDYLIISSFSDCLVPFKWCIVFGPGPELDDFARARVELQILQGKILKSN